MFDFPITVNSIDDIPEEYRPVYRVIEGETGATLLDSLRKKMEAGVAASKTIDTERNSKAAAEMVVQAWRAKVKELFEVDTVEDLGEKWAEIQSAHARAVEDIRDGRGEREEISEKRLLQAIELREHELAKRLAKVEEERCMAVAEKEAMYNSLEHFMRENAAVQALAAAGARGMILLPHVISRTELIKDGNGKYLLRVIDEDGDERFDSDGKPMTVAGLVEEMRQSDEYSFAFVGEGATESKLSASSNTDMSQFNPWSKKSFNATEHAKILKANPALARQLEREAAAEPRRS
jgi:hypothetical protein